MTPHTDAGALLKLLQASSCFRGDVCSSLPCACAESLARQAASQGSAGGEQSEVQTGVDKLIRDHIILNRFNENEDGTTVIDSSGLVLTLSEALRVRVVAQSPDQIEITRLSGLLAEAQKIIAEYKASAIEGARDGGLSQAPDNRARRVWCWWRYYHRKTPEIGRFRYDQDGICCDCGVVRTGIIGDGE